MHILRQNYFVNFVLLLSSIYCYYQLSIKIIQNHSRLNTKFPLKIKKKPKKWLNARICVLSERKKKQSLFFANHFISLKAGKSDYLSPPPVKIQLFPPRFLEKRKKRERGGKEKKEDEIFSHVTQPCRTVESKVSRATRFPYRDTGMKHSLCPAT